MLYVQAENVTLRKLWLSRKAADFFNKPADALKIMQLEGLIAKLLWIAFIDPVQHLDSEDVFLADCKA